MCMFMRNTCRPPSRLKQTAWINIIRWVQDAVYLSTCLLVCLISEPFSRVTSIPLYIYTSTTPYFVVSSRESVIKIYFKFGSKKFFEEYDCDLMRVNNFKRRRTGFGIFQFFLILGTIWIFGIIGIPQNFMGLLGFFGICWVFSNFWDCWDFSVILCDFLDFLGCIFFSIWHFLKSALKFLRFITI